MIYITGDTFADTRRFSKTKVKLKKGDTIIVCGNFGFFCDHDKLAEKSLKWLAKQKYTIAFLHGAIDDTAWLNNLPLVDWHAGKAARASKNVYYLPQGEVYEIEGKTLFCFGGGENLDYIGSNYTEEFYSSSILTPEVMQRAKDNLKRYHNQVDYIITHDAPSKLRAIMQQRKQIENPIFTGFHQFLDEIWEQTKFSGWVFGKYRENHTIAPFYHCVDDRFFPLQ